MLLPTKIRATSWNREVTLFLRGWGNEGHGVQRHGLGSDRSTESKSEERRSNVANDVIGSFTDNTSAALVIPRSMNCHDRRLDSQNREGQENSSLLPSDQRSDERSDATAYVSLIWSDHRTVPCRRAVGGHGIATGTGPAEP